MLPREEYVEQAYFFRMLAERMDWNIPMQELLVSLREEALSTTKLPLAIDFLLSEMRHAGVIGTAMRRLGHYFTPFQTYIVTEAENEGGRFDMRVALEVLHHEAEFRTKGQNRQGVYLYQFETLCRNRLRYDQGLVAMAEDPCFDEDWRQWILIVRRQIGIIDFADMLYVRSQYYVQKRAMMSNPRDEEPRPVLFGVNEGKIAWANRHKDPLLLFSALQRQLGYPTVPRPQVVRNTSELVPQLKRRVERLETRLKLVEEEQKQGIDLTRFYERPPGASARD